MIENITDYTGSYIEGVNKPIPSILVKKSKNSSVINMIVELNPYQMFAGGFQENENDWYGLWPSKNELIAVPPQTLLHVGNAINCKIVKSKKLIPEGWSNANHADAFCCQWPDGEGKWALIDELKPINVEYERNAANQQLNSRFIMGVNDTMKNEALTQAINELANDSRSGELVERTIEILQN